MGDEKLFREMLPGTVRNLGDFEFIGRMPVRTELEILPPPTGPSIAEKEWAEHGNNAVYVMNAGVLDGSWTLAPGGTVLVRGKAGGWRLLDLRKDPEGWFVLAERQQRIPIEWSGIRSCWVSTILL